MLRATLYLVLLVSSAHALVHVYELALPSVEQQIAAEYFGADEASGKAMTGRLSNAWRLMWGFGAIAAGFLVDRFGARRLLAIYLLGCAAACVLAAVSSTQTTLFAAMITMGAFASIYHPAGLSLISHETTADNRPQALGLHGIFGSAGISSAPLLAGLLLAASFTWRQIYWVLVIPGAILGLVFVVQAIRHPAIESRRGKSDPSAKSKDEQDHVDWTSFFTLTAMASVQGFVYSALMSFLPRYLSGAAEWFGWAQGDGNFLAAGVLFAGCGGQALAGRFAKSAILEKQLAWITFGNIPFLVWMAFAGTWDRVPAAGLLALVHFMHQPIYNSLIAKYTPRHRRSLCYGFSFAMGLGLGSFGARFAGAFQSDVVVYGTLAAVAGVGSLICVALCTLNRRQLA
ncbi:MAG: MFS transporter [Planctomycetaceae bacterium]|nr:MFS transporter [Planctomycetaceae bacterium]